MKVNEDKHLGLVCDISGCGGLVGHERRRCARSFPPSGLLTTLRLPLCSCELGTSAQFALKTNPCASACTYEPGASGADATLQHNEPAHKTTKEPHSVDTETNSI